ncbi:hypothetical protein [Cryptosporangium aurantiacum]|uniref:Uncharacterized protein n=1 Tax=Cryptosporangium aurantiacum TaxID=134849 RepID=A0A1M7QRT9_9ACTN|nr:hypothetical protein [Cryptosporangium aurantiacum]SHN34021.1 hypothetical protein SAMN05443668_105210 [Cryptosporangium aurantiacum]
MTLRRNPTREDARLRDAGWITSTDPWNQRLNRAVERLVRDLTNRPLWTQWWLR